MKIKKPAQILHAQNIILETLDTPGLSNDQKISLFAMANALDWVIGRGGSAIQRLINGDRIDPGLLIDTSKYVT